MHVFSPFIENLKAISLDKEKNSAFLSDIFFSICPFIKSSGQNKFEFIHSVTRAATSLAIIINRISLENSSI